MPNATSVHLYVLLDRSGSMASMASDVVGGYNRLLAEQQADGADARLTLVQFDSQDPHEVVVDAVPIREVLPMTAATFQPRGGTPLLDATGRMIAKAASHAEHRRLLGLPPERIIVVTITDGEENQSRELTLQQVRKLVTARQEEGWVFVFLGAGLDAYAEAERLGYAAASVQAYAPDGAGTQAMWSSVSKHTSRARAAARAAMPADAAGFFGDDKEAEEDRRRRGGR
jgi:Mg-chelatase subunit ChlD